MHLEDLPNELLLDILRSCESVSDVLHLAASSRHFHRIFCSTDKLSILFASAERQYGPLKDAIQAVTYNSSQPAHHIRTVPYSLALLKQVLDLGRCAAEWVSLYPSKKWKDDFENRRLLQENESYRVRRAIYRWTLYARAFHNSRHPRTTRSILHTVLERVELLHNWSSAELAEIEDIRAVSRQVLNSQICPSNGTIQRKFRKRFPDSDHQLLFNVNIHLNYPLEPSAAMAAFQAQFYNAHAISPSIRASSRYHESGGEGWGDDIPHYYVLEDMMKLEPAQILWLKMNAPYKRMVQAYIHYLGEWFENNGETFGQTLQCVLEQRDESIEDFQGMIESKVLGIVRES